MQLSYKFLYIMYIFIYYIDEESDLNKAYSTRIEDIQMSSFFLQKKKKKKMFRM